MGVQRAAPERGRERSGQGLLHGTARDASDDLNDSVHPAPALRQEPEAILPSPLPALRHARVPGVPPGHPTADTVRQITSYSGLSDIGHFHHLGAFPRSGLALPSLRATLRVTFSRISTAGRLTRSHPTRYTPRNGGDVALFSRTRFRLLQRFFRPLPTTGLTNSRIIPVSEILPFFRVSSVFCSPLPGLVFRISGRHGYVAGMCDGRGHGRHW